MTDVITTQNAFDASTTAGYAPEVPTEGITDDALNAAAAALAADAGSAGDSTNIPAGGEVQWAPQEPKKRRRWPLALWIGIPVVALGAAGAYFGTTLIAPGVTVAGTDIGLLTPEAAAERIQANVANTGIDVTLGDATVNVTGETLGASIDATALAAAAHTDHQLWMLGAWNPEANAAVPTIDAAAAATALKSEFASVWVDPIDATVVFDAATKTYITTPGVDGAGITPAAVEDAYAAAVVDPKAPTTLEATPETLAPAISTDVATAQAGSLNTMLSTAGFYVGEERTVGLDADRVASWLTVTPDPAAGAFTVSADAAAIQGVVDQLPGFVNRAPVNADVFKNKAGEVTETIIEGQTGREVGDTSSVAGDYAAQLGSLNGNYALPVVETPFETKATVRSIEVSIGEQRIYLKENGAVVDSWGVSTGRPGADTDTGSFTVGWRTPSQTMSGVSLDTGKEYEVDNVQWAMYFNGDQAFHGVYWNDNYLRGQRGSNGCVGMSNADAGKLYEWTPAGTDVYIYN